MSREDDRPKIERVYFGLSVLPTHPRSRGSVIPRSDRYDVEQRVPVDTGGIPTVLGLGRDTLPSLPSSATHGTFEPEDC